MLTRGNQQMQTDQDQLVNYIKAQTEAFLKEMEDYYPFGAAITSIGELKPLGVYLDEDEISVEALLTMLEEHITKNLEGERFRLGAIAVAVAIRVGEQTFDAVQIRFYERDKEMSSVNYKYLVANGITQWL